MIIMIETITTTRIFTQTSILALAMTIFIRINMLVHAMTIFTILKWLTAFYVMTDSKSDSAACREISLSA
ncbi:hypothetical protein ACQCVH_14850 [Bacillus infantis]|uniref:hypothetical protein n=1 Tax=Bacillus infantis TaxID=324767 RepID=UPI003CFA9BBE